MPTPFQTAAAKLSLGTVDQRPNFQVDAQYNPKELQVDRSIPWVQQNMGNAGDGGDNVHVEFTGAQGRSMTIELLFDGYEDGRSVSAQVDSLEAMATVADASSADERDRRPAHCVVAWGDRGVPSFRCVIEQLAIKYTMFDGDGTPLRAVCTVKLREATKLSLGATVSQRGGRRAA